MKLDLFYHPCRFVRYTDFKNWLHRKLPLSSLIIGIFPLFFRDQINSELFLVIFDCTFILIFFPIWTDHHWDVVDRPDIWAEVRGHPLVGGATSPVSTASAATGTGSRQHASAATASTGLGADTYTGRHAGRRANQNDHARSGADGRLRRENTGWDAVQRFTGKGVWTWLWIHDREILFLDFLS